MDKNEALKVLEIMHDTFLCDGSRLGKAIQVICKNEDTEKVKLRRIIIELGCRGALDTSERAEAVVKDICDREGIAL